MKKDERIYRYLTFTNEVEEQYEYVLPSNPMRDIHLYSLLREYAENGYFLYSMHFLTKSEYYIQRLSDYVARFRELEQSKDEYFERFEKADVSLGVFLETMPIIREQMETTQELVGKALRRIDREEDYIYLPVKNRNLAERVLNTEI